MNTDILRGMLAKAVDLLIEQYADELPFDVVTAWKTEAYYEKVLDRLVKKLYNGIMDELEFVMTFTDLVSGQMRRA